ncbi:MAG TPA: acyloxyacyl hydrolase [Cytophagaceae bacterium]|jgi:hypothetical protein|nr:acyloxyacyl hydrolase [Cytophagaceae bacterium]
MKKYFLIIVFSLAIISGPLFAQNEQGGKRKFINEIGLSGGFPYLGTNIEQGKYRPILIMANFAHSFTKNENNKSSLWINFEPQINPASVGHNFKYIEYGLNISMKYSFAIVPCVLVYVMPGYGVYNITVNTERQANGLIFGINLPAGFQVKLNKMTALNFQYRFRHLSNGGLKNPNLGLQNNFIVFGISRFLGNYRK